MAMTLLRVCRAPAISGHSFLCRRRLAVPAFWLLTSFSLGIGIVSLHPFQTQSQPLLPPLRLNITSRISAKGLHSSGMEGNANVVPSIVVYVTVPSKEAGKKLAESIVTEKLAACVNRVPGIESVYWWEGQVQSDAEELLIIKTRESLLDALTQHIKANHEYDLPEVIALPIQGGNIQYLEWIKNSTRDP